MTESATVDEALGRLRETLASGALAPIPFTVGRIEPPSGMGG